jgi:hypothetical protein
VIGGGGIIAVELAANAAEAMKAKGSKGKVTLVSSGKVLLTTYPKRIQVVMRGGGGNKKKKRGGGDSERFCIRFINVFFSHWVS